MYVIVAQPVKNWHGQDFPAGQKVDTGKSVNIFKE